VEATGTAIGSAPPGRYFFLSMAAFMTLLVFVGFAPTYYLAARFDGPALTPLVHVHGVVFTLWMLLFITQTSLVATRRVALHRRLGLAGAVLAPVMIVVGALTMIASAARGQTPLPEIPPLAFMAIPAVDIAVFTILVAAGLAMRRRPAVHKRLMLLATVGMMAPAIARLPFAFIETYGPLAFFPLMDLLVLACFVFDWRTTGRIHGATLFGALIIVASQPLRLALAQTEAWLAFAAWLTGA
jgi:hypothetical protein